MRHGGARPEAQERRSHGAGEGAAPTQVKGRGAAPELGEARRRKEEGGATETRERRRNGGDERCRGLERDWTGWSDIFLWPFIY